MPRPLRADIAGIIYHCLNRANGRLRIFKKDKDYQAFINVLTEAKEQFAVQVLSFCVMPNHWHLLLKPLQNGALSRFMAWLTMTHTQRWHAAHHTVGNGHLYQGRFKSFPVESDEYFIQLARYIETNPLRARLVTKARDWRWSSLWTREEGSGEQKQLLSAWPILPDKNYPRLVDQAQVQDEVDNIRQSIIKNRPLGSVQWIQKTAKELGLQSSLRERGRPKK